MSNGQKQTFPTIRFNGGEVSCYGVSSSGQKALIGRKVPMEERHLYCGTAGGWSKVSIKNEKGQPKQVVRMEMVPFCKQHQVAWLNGAGCPECGDNPHPQPLSQRERGVEEDVVA